MTRPLFRPAALAALVSAALLAPLGAGAQGLKPSAASGLTRLPAAVTTLPSAKDGAPRQADFIVAVVNSDPITNNEVQRRIERTLSQLRNEGATPPSHEVLVQQVLEHLIQEKIQIQTGHEMGLKVDDFAVDQAEQSVARQNGVSVATMHQRLAEDGISASAFREELRNQLLMLRVRERDVESRVRVSDLDVDQYLREQKQAPATQALELNIGNILIGVPENATPAQLAERQAIAQEVLAKIKAGGNWQELAQQYSQAPDAAQGGVMGMRPADRYPQLFTDALAGTAVGGVVGPVRSPAGLHILKLINKEQAGLMSMAEENHARHILLRAQPGRSERQAAQELMELRERIVRHQATFEQLAREYSQDGSAAEGGDLGWALPGRYVPEFEQVLDSLQPGQISEPVATRFGVHLIELIARREVKLTQRQQRDMVRDVVREKKLDEAWRNWMQEARARAYVEYREPPQ
ncbi:peptidylprolyl isomerase SurA [Comamonas faecalis]|uniref:Chaperone SurA n=1 Tax=Comamonas faecalis TaxID=1387849 RepID=A0ABP7QL09_9BURK